MRIRAASANLVAPPQLPRAHGHSGNNGTSLPHNKRVTPQELQEHELPQPGMRKPHRVASAMPR
jgi:hypothetical protein